MHSNVSQCMILLNKIRLLGKKYMKNDDLAPAEFFVLQEIEALSQQEQKATNTRLAEQMGQSISAVSKMIRQLEERSYIMRDNSSTDRRICYISVTDKGRERIQHVKEQHEKISRYVEQKIGQQDMEEFIRLLEQWYEIMKLGMEEQWNA
ncbi:MAG: MarR family transcriptional regulator [Lachnospiraceae bacterium]|nr:MarR family transcriptional regulator [Lachnospiraceae bacterium]